MKQLHQFFLSAAVLLALDSVYLNLNKSAFATQIVQIQRVVMQVKMVPAIICYLLLIFGLNYFILSRHRPVYEAFLLGILIYGVFDSTSYALFKKWDWKLAVMDGIWGGVLYGLTTFIVYNL